MNAKFERSQLNLQQKYCFNIWCNCFGTLRQHTLTFSLLILSFVRYKLIAHKMFAQNVWQIVHKIFAKEVPDRKCRACVILCLVGHHVTVFCIVFSLFVFSFFFFLFLLLINNKINLR